MNQETTHIASNRRKWDRRSKSYDFKIFDYFRWLQKETIDLLDIQPGQHFLDLGCGTGWAVHSIAKKLNDNGKFIGVDISEGMLDKAKQKVNGFQNVHFIKASADQLPFEDNSFEQLICTNSFHHYPNPHKVIAEIERVLKPGGHVLILDVTRDSFLAELLNEYFKIIEKEHVKFYNSREFSELFSLNGLKYSMNKNIMKIFKFHLGRKIR